MTLEMQQKLKLKPCFH